MKINNVFTEKYFIDIATRLLEVLNRMNEQSKKLHLNFKINFRQSSIMSFFFTRKACESFLNSHEFTEMDLESIDGEFTAFDKLCDDSPEVVDLISHEDLQELKSIAEALSSIVIIDYSKIQ